jgi:hypothetical protein
MSVQPTPLVIPGDLFARHQTISGLRALADFLEANPAVPVREYGFDLTVYTSDRYSDACQRTELGRIAALLDAAPIDKTATGGHLTVSKTFGRVSYQAVHIPSRAWADHKARTSYEPNLRATSEAA